MTESTFALGYCHGGSIRGGFLRSILGLLTSPVMQRCQNVIESAGLYIHLNRNNVVRGFLAGDAEWLLFIDTDIVFTPDDITTLLAAGDRLGECVVAGLYAIVQHAESDPVPTWTTACWFSVVAPPTAIALNGATAPIALAGCGMGFTAIHRTILATLDSKTDPAAWFDYDQADTPAAIYALGEDLTFCVRAAARDFRIWGVPAVRVGHEKSQVLHVVP